MPQAFQPIIPQNLLEQEEHQLYDYTSERGMLACIKKWPTLIYEAERLVKDDQLFLPANRAVYSLMLYMSKMAQTNNWQLAFDRPAMLQSAHYMGTKWAEYFLTTTEGMEQVKWIELMEPMVSIDAFPQYAHVVIDRSMRVKAMRYARQIVLNAADFSSNPDARKVLIEAESGFCQLAAHSSTENERQIVRMGSYHQKYIDKALLNRSLGHMGLFNIACPLFPFWMDLMNGGFRRRGMTIVAGRPKSGKSTLLLVIAIHLAVYMGIPVLYLDGEMSCEEMFSRELAHVSQINEHRLLRGRFMDDGNEYASVASAIAAVKDAPLYYVNTAGTDENFILSMMRQFRNNIVGTQTIVAPHNQQPYTFSNPCLVIYDWLKLPSSDSMAKIQEYQALGYLASAIKNGAASLDLPVVAGAQNNRGAIGKEGEDWEEMAESFVAGSDRLAQFCTMLCILRNLSQKEQDLVQQSFQTREGRHGANALAFNQMLHIPLQRGGNDFRLGIPLHLDRGYARYQECMGSTHEQQEWMQDWLKANFRKKKKKAVMAMPGNRALIATASAGDMAQSASGMV